MENEIWKDILNYEGYYQVSNLGRIKSLKRYVKKRWDTLILIDEKILKPILRKDGYYRIKLCKNGNYDHPLVHQVVLKTFVKNLENKPQINHINGDKSNNKLNNLEWTTISENIQHSYNNNLHKKLRGVKNGASKLTETDILEIRKIGKLRKVKDTAFKYNITTHTVWCILNNKSWTHI